MGINLFDANFYRQANSDLASFDNIQAVSHFQNYGIDEGRSFSGFADLNFYRASNPDLASFSNRQAYDHLSNYGVAEGRKFSPFFDLNFYRSKNGDLNNLSNEQLFDHLRSFGVSEGRSFSRLIDLNFYRTANADLKNLNNPQALEHLQKFGLAEGRRFSSFIDLNVYQAANPDLLAAGFNKNQLFEHLANYGVAQGRRYSISFDSNYYRSSYSDLAQANLNPYQLLGHFQDYGLAEGRISSESFNSTYYLNTYSDLRAAGFTRQLAQQHFEIYGYKEGRQAAPASSVSLSPNRVDNSLDTAANLGILNGSRNFSNQFVGVADRNDYYRFTVAQTSNFNTSLTGLTDTAYVELIYDANGNNRFDSGEQIGSSFSASINEALGAGTYFLRVYTYNANNNTNYSLGVSTTPAPITTPRDPGNTLRTAYDIGFLNGTSVFKEFVGAADRDDYYRFSLSNNRTLKLDLTELSAYAYVELIQDSNGNGVVDSRERFESFLGINSISESLPLGTGTYFLRVYSYYTGSNTNYTLTLLA
ncbi:MAG: PPC domain-containing protein [Nostoc sp. CreGUA01]|nr:PPC domain-containing protein [Nostoc sp. CreGUA01]